MSIRALALELYRAQKQVAELQKKIEDAGDDGAEKYRQPLREAEKEMCMLRKMLDGRMQSGSFPGKLSRFGG